MKLSRKREVKRQIFLFFYNYFLLRVYSLSTAKFMWLFSIITICSLENIRKLSFWSVFARILHFRYFQSLKHTSGLRENGPFLEFFWSVFSRIRTEYGEIRSIAQYSVRIQKNTDQKISEYGHFSCSADCG